MSNKVTTFIQTLGNPLNTYNFVTRISFLSSTIEILVNTTNFPTEMARVIEKWFQGEQIRYPALPENDGEWVFTIPEAEDGKIFSELVAARSLLYNQVAGTHITPILGTIEIVSRTMNDAEVFSVLLHDAWIKGMAPVTLDNSNPIGDWVWEVTTSYNWIEYKTKP